MFDENYVQWLLLHHPEAVKKECLEKVSASSKIFSSGQKELQTSKITLSYPSGEKEAQNEDEQSDVSEESENYVIITLFTAT